MHSDAARAGLCIRKRGSGSGTPGPVCPISAGAGLAGRGAAGRAGLLGHELLNKILESSIHGSTAPLGCYGPGGEIPAHLLRIGSGAGQRNAITPQSIGIGTNFQPHIA